jgi:hypothetical protein
MTRVIDGKAIAAEMNERTAKAAGMLREMIPALALVIPALALVIPALALVIPALALVMPAGDESAGWHARRPALAQ